MRRMLISLLPLWFGLAVPGLAQQWEFGGMGGYGVQMGLSAERDNASAETGFRHGGAAGAFVGNNLYSRIGGEVRYLYRWSDLRVASGGQEVTFSGRSHIVHYDFLFHTEPVDANVRPFVAVGVGGKVFEGTGVERAFQPLSQFVLLTKTREVLPVFAFGGGAKWNLRDHLRVRVEVRDYLTPAPQHVLVPAVGARITGWLHDIVPLVSLAYTF